MQTPAHATTHRNSHYFRASPIIIQLSDNAIPREVQVLKVGTFYDPRYGSVEITPKMLITMRDNFDNNVRKLAIAFDYEHNSDGVAAGWVQKVNLRKDDTELWAEVSWTPSGGRKLADQEYRYVSADFALNYIDNETLKEHGPCLLGAALTNRPVIKGMDPITLTEGEGNMDPKDQMIAQLQAEIAKLKAQIGGGAAANPELSAMTQKYDESQKMLSEMNVKLSEASKKITDFEAKEKKAEEDRKLSEKKAAFEQLMKEGKAVKAQEEAFLKGDMEAYIKLAEVPNLNGKGNAGAEGSKEAKDKESATAEVMKLAEAKCKENKELKMDKAISLVLSENPKLNDMIYPK